MGLFIRFSLYNICTTRGLPIDLLCCTMKHKLSIYALNYVVSCDQPSDKFIPLIGIVVRGQISNFTSSANPSA